jgi:hypothetical protein
LQALVAWSQRSTGTDAYWDWIVEGRIKRPDAIKTRILAQQEEPRAQGASVDGEAARERAVYQRQPARGKLMELEFDTCAEYTGRAAGYCQAELDRLRVLRDNSLQRPILFSWSCPCSCMASSESGLSTERQLGVR